MRCATLSRSQEVTPHEGIALAQADVAENGRVGALVQQWSRVFPCSMQYSKPLPPSGTVMRYFFSLARPETALSIGIGVASTTRCAIPFASPAHRGRAGLLGTATGAIHLAAITAPAHHHLVVTTRAVEHPGTGEHRRTPPMRARSGPVVVRLSAGCAKARLGRSASV